MQKSGIMLHKRRHHKPYIQFNIVKKFQSFVTNFHYGVSYVCPDFNASGRKLLYYYSAELQICKIAIKMKFNIFITIRCETYHMISDVSSHWWLIAPTITCTIEGNSHWQLITPTITRLKAVTGGFSLSPIGVCLVTD